MKPRIGITYSDEIKVEPYAAAVRASGGEPIPIEPGSAISAKDLDGLLLGGGVDVNPALYGEQRQPETEESNDARDETERLLLSEALNLNLPILAICRGMQMLNVAAGGNLRQHMTGHETRTADKFLPAHEVSVDASSLLHRVLLADGAQVNSRHHQAVERVASDLRVTAWAADGTVEAVEDPSHDFVIGVQWHPEDMAARDPIQKRLFDEFVTRARG